jgi:8-oxo-dGTP diphosphatase
MHPNYFRYTLIFLTRNSDVLMLHRHNPPNQGLWNGVGGHLEPGETPLDGALREVYEETGYELTSAHFAGVLTWEGHTETPGGLYIFTTEIADGIEPHPLSGEEEGELVWKSREWVLSSPEVVHNIHHFGPYIFQEPLSFIPDFHFVYDSDDRILEWEIKKYNSDGIDLT